MSASLLVLEVHLDGVVDAHFGKRVVPVEDALTQPAAVPDRNRVLDVVNDGLLGRRHLQAGVPLLEIPTMDVSLPFGFLVVVAKVTVAGHEVTNSVVCFTRLVAVVPGQVDNRKVQTNNLAASIGDIERHHGVLGEGLGGDDFGQARVQTTESQATSGGAKQQAVQVHDGLARWTHRKDGNVKQHGVGEDSSHRVSGFLFTVGPGTQLGRHDHQAVTVALPVHQHFGTLQSGKDGATVLRGRNDVLLSFPTPGQFCQKVVVFLPDSIERSGTVRGRNHFFVSVGHLVEFWEVGGRQRSGGQCECDDAMHGRIS